MKHFRPLLFIGLTALLLAGWQLYSPSWFARFEGTDDQSVTTIQSLAPNYRPIAQPVLEFEQEEAEPWLFVLQSILGLGVAAAGWWYFKRPRTANSTQHTPHETH